MAFAPFARFRNFTVENLKGKYYFVFEGVSSCFYLYINGEFAAYSQVSHNTTEVDITDKLVDGENVIDVVVVKWCDGSYLEDQDMFRLSGIFREVYILERSENAIKDIYLKTELNEVKTSVSEGKALIAAAVTGKGVSTAADATF